MKSHISVWDMTNVLHGFWIEMFVSVFNVMLSEREKCDSSNKLKIASITKAIKTKF